LKNGASTQASTRRLWGLLQSDTAALKACAKGHPFLSKLAERYLYVNVAVHNGSYTAKADENALEFREITKLLSDNPYIANYVRTLAFCITRDASLFRPQDLVEVSSVLPMFLGLTKVALRAVGTRGSSNSWPTLPETFRQAFLDCIHMKEALLEHVWSFQLTHLNNCKTVTLSQLQLPQHIDSNVSTARLKSLSIENYDWDTFSIGGWVQTLSLHSLRLSLPSESAKLDALHIPEFLTVCPNTLINLEFDFKNKRKYGLILFYFHSEAERVCTSSKFLQLFSDRRAGISNKHGNSSQIL